MLGVYHQAGYDDDEDGEEEDDGVETLWAPNVIPLLALQHTVDVNVSCRNAQRRSYTLSKPTKKTFVQPPHIHSQRLSCAAFPQSANGKNVMVTCNITLNEITCCEGGGSLQGQVMRLRMKMMMKMMKVKVVEVFGFWEVFHFLMEETGATRREETQLVISRGRF
ncbi:hypothetical protein F7725_022121 [Dissostichus mawsoni]|uniref:Uncharacterized protein n=1 Tax=Dissostichus mawsoni TaxID=36200 RepID=A0A7J5ZD15_DISMA|nr:hypothetical protein F7725_022121 [Dissostichus mawsoni]